jgi:hypothetical protein
MAHRTEYPVADRAPRAITDDPVCKLLEAQQERRASRLLARTFGPMGLFGVLDFISALLRGTASPIRFVSLASAICFCVVGVLAWRESTRMVAAEELDLSIPRTE